MPRNDLRESSHSLAAYNISLQIYEVEETQLRLTASHETPHCIKCCTCWATPTGSRQLVTGNAAGDLDYFRAKCRMHIEIIYISNIIMCKHPNDTL